MTATTRSSVIGSLRRWVNRRLTTAVDGYVTVPDVSLFRPGDVILMDGQLLTVGDIQDATSLQVRAPRLRRLLLR